MSLSKVDLDRIVDVKHIEDVHKTIWGKNIHSLTNYMMGQIRHNTRYLLVYILLVYYAPLSYEMHFSRLKKLFIRLSFYMCQNLQYDVTLIYNRELSVVCI